MPSRLAAAGGVLERLGEVVVGVVDAVDLGVVPLGRAALDLHRVEVPLGVGVLPQHPLGAALDEELLNVGHAGRPARHRVEPPVEEDPQLGVVVPDRHPVGADGFPRPLIHGGCFHPVSPRPRDVCVPCKHGSRNARSTMRRRTGGGRVRCRPIGLTVPSAVGPSRPCRLGVPATEPQAGIRERPSGRASPCLARPDRAFGPTALGRRPPLWPDGPGRAEGGHEAIR